MGRAPLVQLVRRLFRQAQRLQKAPLLGRQRGVFPQLVAQQGGERIEVISAFRHARSSKSGMRIARSLAAYVRLRRARRGCLWHDPSQ
jgi:plasmid stabilization system protein ParE